MTNKSICSIDGFCGVKTTIFGCTGKDRNISGEEKKTDEGDGVGSCHLSCPGRCHLNIIENGTAPRQAFKPAFWPAFKSAFWPAFKGQPSGRLRGWPSGRSFGGPAEASSSNHACIANLLKAFCASVACECCSAVSLPELGPNCL